VATIIFKRKFRKLMVIH